MWETEWLRERSSFSPEAAPVIELPVHKVPLDQVNVTLARDTFAVKGPGLSRVSGCGRLLQSGETV